MNRKLTGPPTPADLMDIGRQSAIVGQALKLWEGGHCTWEQALAIAIVYLYDQNQHLMVKTLTHQALGAVVPDGLAALTATMRGGVR